LSSICIFPPQTGQGGPASFTGRLVSGLKARGYEVHHDPQAKDCAVVLVIGGTRHLDALWQAQRRGVRIVQRLNGMNWLHRRMRTGIKHYLRSEVNNWILTVIRSRLADRIIYQSQFSRDWWHSRQGVTRASSTIIYNGVDLNAFSADGPEARPGDVFRILMVEGHLGGVMTSGLENALGLLGVLGKDPSQSWELMVAGKVPEENRAQIAQIHPQLKIRWTGVIQRDQVPQLDRSAHLLFSADLNAACPNSVIEALACGLPVLAYATGALPEMVTAPAGLVVPYGSDHWKLESPVVEPLAQAARQIVQNQAAFRSGARARAVAMFDIQKIIAAYLENIL
jgi:glycosyltransferase involved in cell wall biosynthesis